jgi:ATP-dependent helicase HrpB
VTRLPVDEVVPGILESLRRIPNLVLEAPPGAGKTTRVPPALLRIVDGEVIVLEPRRIAARMAARRVAEEMGQRLGETVGYQVRFEEVAGSETRLRFVTEGVLTRRLLRDRTLQGVSAVILDEFHERHLETDLALALLRRLQHTERPDLKIVVMSATLDSAPVARFLNHCPVMRSEGKLFELSVEHLPYSSQPLAEQVASAVRRLGKDKGDILVFLPGAAEIRAAMQACQQFDLMALPLHGDLTAAEQDRAVAPANRRKLILATNVAESSITIDGVTAVIDSGLARVASDSAWTGLPTLQIARISKASATQRAGRAARTAPGKVLRLYTLDDYQRRPDQDAPEIMRRELAQLSLDLRVMGIGALNWLDPPPAAALAVAQTLLDRLSVSRETARRMAAFPLHPRLAKLVLEADSDEGCRAAALLSSGARSANGDLLTMLDGDLDGRATQIYHQIRRIARLPRSVAPHPDTLARAVLAAFPDRVGRLRKGRELLLCSGNAALLAADAHAEFLVALDVEDRPDKALPLVRLYCPIQPEWLLDQVQERAGLEWNRIAERVESKSALVYENLVIEEMGSGAVDLEQAAALLARKAIDAGVDRFIDSAEWAGFCARMTFAGLPEPDLEAGLVRLCIGLKSFAELKSAATGLIPALEPRTLETLAPSKIKLPGGRTTRVHYEQGKPPWIASRLQDFFGMRETPRIGKVPLVVHLLAPNQRPMQTTSDLAGFWERLYPQLRRELGRRYPKHKWPENPLG